MTRVPRYRTLADSLRADVQSGRYPVGSQLPTELELCRTEGVSRHTARDALRLLREAGLVERRQGAGTTVVSTQTAKAFVQPLGGVSDLLQYAREARLIIRQQQVRPLMPFERQQVRTEDDTPWLVVEGVRSSGGEPLALTSLLIAPQYAEIADSVEGWAGALQELIEQRFGAPVERIEQEIAASTLDAPAARLLEVDRGSAGLRTVRRYYGGDGQLMILSDSLHPAGRFVYQMTYRREG